MALPRFTAPLPVILSFNASKPPGMSRFLATWSAAMHCPRFLNPEHALWRSLPGTVTPDFDKAFVSAVFKLLLLCSSVVGEPEPIGLLEEAPGPISEDRPVLPGPTSEGRPTLPGAPTPDGRPIPPAGRCAEPKVAR